MGKITRLFDSDTIVRTPDSYHGGVTTPYAPVAHAPDFVARYRALANAIEVPPEITDPMERALFKWRAAEDMRDDLLIDDEGDGGAAREALEIGADVQRDRPPAAAPLPSEAERMEKARAVLDVAAEMKGMALNPQDKE